MEAALFKKFIVMKKSLLLMFVIALVLSSCGFQEEEIIDIKAETDLVQAVLDQYVIANEEQNFSLIETIWAANENIVLIGTDSDEKLIGWSQIEEAFKHQFEAFKETFIVVSEQNIRLNETANTAWFSEIMNYNFIYNDEAKSFSGIRFTGILEKIEGKWLLVQGHLSIPAEAQLKEVY